MTQCIFNWHICPAAFSNFLPATSLCPSASCPSWPTSTRRSWIASIARMESTMATSHSKKLWFMSTAWSSTVLYPNLWSQIVPQVMSTLVTFLSATCQTQLEKWSNLSMSIWIWRWTQHNLFGTTPSTGSALKPTTLSYRLRFACRRSPTAPTVCRSSWFLQLFLLIKTESNSIWSSTSTCTRTSFGRKIAWPFAKDRLCASIGEHNLEVAWWLWTTCLIEWE